ncbi:alternative NAD(P)H-ubiquinone oxidoreductase C1, chloroplastic/mitochondrial isoform X3 [Corylus avellana]|uniref:alternative NAD(P)H-ubiquinone oxidoreductase C1, chloroplastic/mitochondrial isoform X3 n=1 Tax=Corylus avellana TaxID=13451 RepID=UPI00286B6ED7|nr:alternative NAD(P)H-ubiquinone oxidoreductase C1, chloroplastic/mitochondrial isoform X3 [Corylus avellana]
MAQFALTTSAALLPFNRMCGAKQWPKLFPGLSKRYGTDLALFTSFRKKGVGFVASGTTGWSGGVAELSEGETAPQSYVWPDKKPRVCILGGGFGGLYTALRLESLVWPDDKKPQVLLVDQSERFVFKPMLYELLSGEVDAWEIAPRFSDLLANTSVQFFQDRVKVLHPTDHLGINGRSGSNCGGTVHLESGLLIEYDWLVLALGAESKLDVVPGASESALPFSILEDAQQKVDNKLRRLERSNFGKFSPIRVAVVGCGYSGVELAATVAERLQDRGIVQAINVETTICPTAQPGNREAALKVLSSRKVQLLLGYFVRCIQRVDNVEASEMSTSGIAAEDDHEKYILELQPANRGLQIQILEADLVLWTVGSKPLLPELEPSGKPNELPLNARGQAETDETLRVKGHPRIFALGDSAALRDSNGRLLPATAQVAFQQADFAGWNLWAAINDRPLLPFRFQNLGEMMTLGRNDAAISPSFIEGLTLEGPIGHTARKIAYLIRLPTDQHRLKVGISWLTKSAIDSVASLQSTLTKVLSGS